MIGKHFRRDGADEGEVVKGYDAFEVRLGDMLRGERATLGKSLLDVQRELKIKAAYIAAIENADPSAFDTPGFIAGYVRSYARYLNIDPEWAFETFCKESGFATAHGMSAAASSPKRSREERLSRADGKDIFASPSTPFVPAGDAFLSRIEPGAVGSVFVLVALIGGLGFGGWTILQEVQKVQFAPIEQTPVVVAELDPLAGVAQPEAVTGNEDLAFTAPSNEALDRLYRPQALDVPVLIARDGPISTLNPASVGTLPVVPDSTVVAALDAADPLADPAATPAIQVTEQPVAELQMVAVRPAWVRVRAADGTVIFEGIMNAGDTWLVPSTEEPATLRVGESGAVYFAINGAHYGPVGERGTITKNLPLAIDSLTAAYAVADLGKDSDLAALVDVAQVQPAIIQPAVAVNP